jgi:hypothetical protein
MGLGSEIRDPEKPIPDPGVKKAPDPDPQHCGVLNLPLRRVSVRGTLCRVLSRTHCELRRLPSVVSVRQREHSRYPFYNIDDKICLL